MENEERARIETLVPSHEELRQLWEEHLELERQLDAGRSAKPGPGLSPHG